MEAGNECPNCHCGTLEETDEEFVCRGECGEVWPKECRLKLFMRGRTKMFELRNVDTKLLREQRDALLTSIDDAEDFAQYGDSGTSEAREKQVQLLDGLVNMIDDMLDAIEFTRPPEMAQHPLWEEGPRNG